MIFPEPLKKGDNVFLFCPSSPIIPEEDIEKCKKVITDLGFNPVIGKSLYENYGGYMAGKAEIRIEDLHKAFSRKNIKGIFCVKGGYSASQLLDKIDYELIRNNPKVFVGYSDVTNLHIVFNQKCNLGTYHGPMVKSNMINDFNEKDLRCLPENKRYGEKNHGCQPVARDVVSRRFDRFADHFSEEFRIVRSALLPILMTPLRG